MALADAPEELQVAIREYWPSDQWENASEISRLESEWNPFAVNDTTRVDAPCGTVIEHRGGVAITAELSVGYFQINACNLPPDWDWHRLYNARHNAGTAHLLWDRAGRSWSPWFFSAKRLGLL
jgi:hypothetical protein